MAKQTTADAMAQAMIGNVMKKLSGDDLYDVVKEANKYIAIVEAGSKEVKKGFGGALGMFYIFQALAFRVMSDEKNDATFRQKSEKIIEKALTIAAQQGEEDQEYANKLIAIIRTPEKADRSLIQQLLNVAVPSKKSKSKSSSSNSFGDRMSDLDIKKRFIRTGVGILSYVLGALFVYLIFLIKIKFLVFLAVVPCYLLGFAGLKGWNWMSQYEINTFGGFIKCFSFLIIIAGSGTIASLYWTGKTLSYPLLFLGPIGIIAVLYWTGKGTLDYLGW